MRAWSVGTRGGKARSLLIALSVAFAVPIVVVASVHAANSSKPYLANVHQTLNTPGSFTLSLTNDPKAQQTLGSANFTPPPGFVAMAVSNVSSGAFTVAIVDNVVQFRAVSSGLVARASVSADIAVTIPAACAANDGSTSAEWDVRAKQSNDFNGAPGNFLNLDPASGLTPLGSFVVAPITTTVSTPDGPLAVPQVLVGVAAPLAVTAKDTCGNADSDYSGGSMAAKSDTPTRLVDATFSSLSWSGSRPRTGAASVTPAVVEALDQIVVSDSDSGISADSTSFDVVEKLCAVTGTVCTWQNKSKAITATSIVPGDSAGKASLGLGFRPLSATCTLPTGTVVPSFGDGVQINPVNYTAPYQVILNYAKSITGNGPASNFNVCLSKDNGITWFPIPRCTATPVANCADPNRVSGGALQITLYLLPNDPLGGGFG
jgi:hypothetical protein